MALPIAAAAIAALAPVVAGALGRGASEGDRRTSEELARLPLEEWQRLSVPEKRDLQLHLERLQSAGKLDPRLETLVEQGPAAMEQVYSDPRLKAQRMENLQAMQAVAEAGGYDPAVKADLLSALRQQEQSIKANQEALAMQAQARGMESSGARQALEAMAAQSAANRTSDLQSQLAAQAYRNRLAALSGASSEAAGISAADLSEKSARAQARDEIQRFNTQLKAQIQGKNVDRQNVAQEANLKAAQELLAANTGIQHKEEEARAQAEKDIFNMRTGRAAGISGAAGAASESYANRAAGTAGQIQGAGDAISKFISSGAMSNIGGAAGAAGNSAIQQQSNNQWASLNPYRNK